MKRITTQVRIGDQTVRWTVRVEDQHSQHGTSEARTRQALFMSQLGDELFLTQPGGHPFDKLTIEHNGVCWTAVAVAEVTDGA